mmetsp:Transcript_14942/g.52452  ORF Transcript_14942/g.52452 Transcript_14942/m.52452 type:complete len:242 (+) Transcript_14942:62-787(+)
MVPSPRLRVAPCAARTLRRRAHSTVLAAAALAIGTAVVALGAGMATALPPADCGQFSMRICGKCIKRSAFDPTETLQELERGAKQAGWPAPAVVRGGCVRACQWPPNVELVYGGNNMAIVVDGMSDKELHFKSFVEVDTEGEATRAFGLASQLMVKRCEFQIQVDRSSGDSLGIQVGMQDGATLLVEAIAEGAVERWNEQHPGEAVAPGDRIVEVNGVRTLDDMLNECKKQELLDLSVRRR